jgi:O-antigen/teichoic acid export membrane protein
MKIPGFLTRPSGFLKNTLILILGTGIAQSIPILLQPVLRRVYSPEDFGAFAVYFSMIGILTVIANFRYDLAIGLPEKDEDGANLVFLSLVINFIFNIILLVIIVLFRNDIALIFKFPEKFSYFLFLLPFSTFFFCSFQAMNFWLIRKKAFTSLTINKISRRGAEGVVQVTFGLFRNSAGLFWADVAGSISNNISGLRQLRKTGFRANSFSHPAMVRLMKRYRDFPKFNLIPQLLGTIAMQLPVFMINRLFTKTELGFFDLSQQAILAPFSLISVAVWQVLLQRVTEKKQTRKKLLRDFFAISLILSLIGLVSVIVIELWGPGLFSFVFGHRCWIAGNYARILVVGYLFFLVISPMGAVLMGLEEIRLFSIWNVVHFALLMGLYFVREMAFTDFLKLFVSIEIVAFSIFYLLVMRTVMKYDKHLSDRFPDDPVTVSE